MKKIAFFLAMFAISWFLRDLTVAKTSRLTSYGLSISPVYAADQLMLEDDFEIWSLKNWRVSKEMSPYWEIKQVAQNSILCGKGATFISTGGADWQDFSFKVKVNRINGSFQITFRSGDAGRYFIGFDEKRNLLYLDKEYPRNKFTSLSNANVNINRNQWYAVNIVAKGNNIKVFLDNSAQINYTDKEAILNGSVQLISLDKDSEIYFDDVKVEKLTP